MSGFDRLFSMIIDDSISREFYSKNISEHYNERVSRFMEFLKGEGNFPCILLDEPCSGLDARHQIEVWKIIHAVAFKKRWQVIVSSR